MQDRDIVSYKIIKCLVQVYQTFNYKAKKKYDYLQGSQETVIVQGFFSPDTVDRGNLVGSPITFFG